MKQLFRTRTLKHEDYANSGLKRCLSAFDLTLLGIGAIIGTGVTETPDQICPSPCPPCSPWLD